MDDEAVREQDAELGPKKPWATPSVIVAELCANSDKLSSTAEFYVPTFHRTLGPS
ncbi:hypothetical protein [Sphingomonas alpina]|uniref:Uncharacterized protein n=1 Tax=Sphingomonas alpina TaxID=653931 RepID=A0A7H0LD31_9SPHN|nr:hypothetical protein [Sphingomonas alpina]QNQ07584.1 hypothetical protein H3Z74_12145 [Sphingomonas alpina]